MEKKIREFLTQKPGYLKKSNQIILERLNISPVTEKKLKTCGRIKKEITSKNKYLEYPVTPDECYDPNNILVIGDTHFPFDLLTYLDFLKDTYDKYKCNKVIHIGDCVDFHALSYHETETDGMSAKDELALAKKHMQRYYKIFPNMDVIFGNHSRMVARKAMTGGIPKEWIRDYADVFEVPNWKYHNELIIDNVLYTHGDKSSKARIASKRDMISTVTGHYHTDQYVEWHYGRKSSVFGMAVGCGINDKKYAFAYAQGGKKNAIGCGLVLDNGKIPITISMPIENYKKTKYDL